ncbi:MAG: hypothetical protein M0P13_07510, partial [Fibrobacteraceae bacterium]|nr:hypothetical protein [Fibrobacteraceae bacterium]
PGGNRLLVVAVSRCSILTPSGADLNIGSSKPDVPWREPASRHKNEFLEVPIIRGGSLKISVQKY